MRPRQLSRAIKVLSRIPFKDTAFDNVLVSFKPSHLTRSNTPRASSATQAPGGVELPFWVRRFLTIPSEATMLGPRESWMRGLSLSRQG